MASTSVVNQAPEIAVPETNPMQFLLQMSSGYMVSAALYVVAKLKIAESLANGPLPISTLAAKTRTNEDALYRVMRALSSVDIFSEPVERTFKLNDNAHFLRADVPGSARDMVLWVTNKLHFDVWSEMMHSVQTGQPSIEHVYKKPCFEVFEPQHEFTGEFNNAMTNLSAMTIPAVLATYDFSAIKTLVDVGGGHGYLLCEILKRYPAMRGIIFDLEPVVAGAKPRIHANGLTDRLDCHCGNFFEAAPVGGDAYIMQHIIHDWNDEKALTILKNVRQALDGKPNGKLLILDSIVQPGTLGDFTTWKDLEMLLMPGGRERTESEFRDLLARAGFKVTRVVPTPAMVSVIEAIPV